MSEYQLEPALPEFPMTWRVVRLGDLVQSIEAGQNFKCEERPPRGDEVGVIKVSAVTWGEYDEEESKTCTDPSRVDPRRIVTAGDFLFSRANTLELVGACVIATRVTRRLMLSDKILRLRLHSVEPKWLLYVLRSCYGRAEMERLATGNQLSMRNISQESIRRLRVPLPPPVEQRRIVAAIEEHLSDLDAGVASLKRVQANLKRYRASVLKAAVEGRLVPTEGARSPPLRVQPERPHVLPPGWREENLGSVSEIQGGIQKQPSRAPKNNSYPFLRVANVLRRRLSLDEVHRVELFPGELERLRLAPGDLLVVEGNGSAGEIGRAAIWDGSIPDCVHQNHLIRVRARDGLLPEFLELYWNSPTGAARVGAVASSTSGLFTLSVRKVAALPVPLPPLAEQRKIIAACRERLDAAERLTADVDAQVRRAGRLRQSILKRAFEGKLVEQDPTDKPEVRIVERAATDPTPNPTRRHRPHTRSA